MIAVEEAGGPPLCEPTEATEAYATMDACATADTYATMDASTTTDEYAATDACVTTDTYATMDASATTDAYAATDVSATSDAHAVTDADPDCIQPDRQAYLFTAKSGTGKSTHARLWREMLGTRAVMVNDDKPLIRVTDQGVLAYGTPWDGKHRLSSNICVPLKAVCILEQSPENHIRRITPTEAMPFLLQQVYRPSDPGMLARTLELIDRMAKSVSFYKLACNMDPEAAQLSHHTMVTDESPMPIIERVPG